MLVHYFVTILPIQPGHFGSVLIRRTLHPPACDTDLGLDVGGGQVKKHNVQNGEFVYILLMPSFLSKNWLFNSS